jgi:hypothetical protein
MSCSSINQKGMQDYFDNLKWHTFIWSAKTLIKTSNNFLFFASMSLLFLSKPSKCKFVINQIDCPYQCIHFMKKSKIVTSIPQNLVIYHIKNLCHHIEHTLLQNVGVIH